MRLHPATENIPKPLVLVGDRPLLWHLMKYYSHFGCKDFILCLGYKGEEIKKFFLNYDECLSSDFILSQGGGRRQLVKSDVEDWRITFIETGLHSNVGQRLRAVQKFVEGEEIFLANYADGLTDLYLPNEIEFFNKHGKTGCFLAVRPSCVFHVVSITTGGYVGRISPMNQSNLRINGGYFIFNSKIFDYIGDGEDLVNEPFERLINKRELVAYKYDGFWASLDTYKDKQRLDELASTNNAFWQIWVHRNKSCGEKKVA